MDSIFSTLFTYGIVPTVTGKDIGDTVALVRALAAGGIDVAMLPMDSSHTLPALAAIATELPKVTVGVCGILTCDDANRAADAGAKFVTSFGCDLALIEHCKKKELPILPGCATPSEVALAISAGLCAVQLFPIHVMGGHAMLDALRSAYPDMRFLLSGGITSDNAASYLHRDEVLACDGSFLIPVNRAVGEEYAAVTEAAKQALLQMLGFELIHIGVNLADDVTAKAAADLMTATFGFIQQPATQNSVFCNKFEFMCGCGRGKVGHLAIGTNTIERAIALLSLRGYAFDPDSAIYGTDGKRKLIFFRDDFFGFAVHISQKA